MCSDVQNRILEISKKKKLSHIGSCLSVSQILDDIYANKNADDIVILSSGHAGLALYVVLEKYLGHDAEELFDKHGVHPNRDLNNDIYLSTGSLGMGVTVAVGAALASPQKTVYCVLSDGECAEGSVWESLSFIHRNKINNLRIFINANGFSAYDLVDIEHLKNKVSAFCSSEVVKVVDTSQLDPNLPLSRTLEDHYKIL